MQVVILLLLRVKSHEILLLEEVHDLADHLVLFDLSTYVLMEISLEASMMDHANHELLHRCEVEVIENQNQLFPRYKRKNQLFVVKQP